MNEPVNDMTHNWCTSLSASIVQHAAITSCALSHFFVISSEMLLGREKAMTKVDGFRKFSTVIAFFCLKIIKVKFYPI